METTGPENAFATAAALLGDLQAQVKELSTKLADMESELEDLREGTGWLTVQEAAEHSSRSPHQVYRLLYEANRNGLAARGVVSKAKGRWRIHRGRFDRWLASQTGVGRLDPLLSFCPHSPFHRAWTMRPPERRSQPRQRRNNR